MVSRTFTTLQRLDHILLRGGKNAMQDQDSVAISRPQRQVFRPVSKHKSLPPLLKDYRSGRCCLPTGLLFDQSVKGHKNATRAKAQTNRTVENTHTRHPLYRRSGLSLALEHLRAAVLVPRESNQCWRRCDRAFASKVPRKVVCGLHALHLRRV